MKAILIIDMPEDCFGCPCYQGMSGDSFCGVLNEDTMINTDTKPKHCPLKPMPNHLPTPYLFRQIQIADGLQNADGSVPTYSEDYMNGWNDCIDGILGENE